MSKPIEARLNEIEAKIDALTAKVDAVTAAVRAIAPVDTAALNRRLDDILSAAINAQEKPE